MIGSLFVFLLSLTTVVGLSCTPSYGGNSIHDELTSPDVYTVTLTASNSVTPIVIQVNRSWSPIGADHFYTLIREGYYDCAAFYTVVPYGTDNAYIQTGIAADPTVTEKWSGFINDDDATVIRKSNTQYTVTYVAENGYGTRSTYFIINLDDNSHLDNNGWYPFGEVIEGIETFQSFDFAVNVDGEDYVEGGNEWLFTEYDDGDVPLITKMETKFSSSSGNPDRTGSWIFGVLMIMLSSAACVYAGLYLYRYFTGSAGYDTMSPDSTGSTERIIALNNVEA